MLTTYDLDEYLFGALQAGAAGFLLKGVSPEELLEGVRQVTSGDCLLAPSATRRLIDEFVASRRTDLQSGAERGPRQSPRSGEHGDRYHALLGGRPAVAVAAVRAVAPVRVGGEAVVGQYDQGDAWRDGGDGRQYPPADCGH